MVTRAFKRLAKTAFRACGFELDYYYQNREEGARVANWAKRCGSRVLLDVGANIGQFAISVIQAGFPGKVISFEPMEQEHRRLLERSRKHLNWEIGMRCALGDCTEEGSINRSGNSYSSSMLHMHDAHVRASPGSAMIGSETVSIRRLDDIDSVKAIAGDIFLKVDVQGYELNVLRGAEETVGKVDGMMLEVSFAPLYEGSPLFTDILDHVRGFGFSLVDFIPGIHAPEGTMLQGNIVVVRDGALSRDG